MLRGFLLSIINFFLPPVVWAWNWRCIRYNTLDDIIECLLTLPRKADYCASSARYTYFMFAFNAKRQNQRKKTKKKQLKEISGSIVVIHADDDPRVVAIFHYLRAPEEEALNPCVVCRAISETFPGELLFPFSRSLVHLLHFKQN